MQRLRVACIQMRSGIRQTDNISDLENMVAEAAKDGANYIQTPEMTGLLERDPAALQAVLRPQEDDPVFAACADLARRYGVWLHLGSTAVGLQSERAANRGALFATDGRLVATYDKIHMFDVSVDEDNRWQESKRYKPGDRAVVAGMGGFGLGMSICYDLRFPQLYRQLAKAGASILSCPAAFTVPTGKAHWEILLRARAIENGAFMIAAAQGGTHEDGRKTWGRSIVVGPWGEIVASLDHDEPAVLCCDIDLDEVGKARASIPNLANERKFAISKAD